jgi:deoxyribonucleoside regulator
MGAHDRQERYRHMFAVDDSKPLEAAVAQLYHLELKGSQSHIAERLGIDRRKVRPLLEAAHAHRLVEVRVHHPLRHRVDLADALREACPTLSNTLVIEAPRQRHQTKEEVGRAAAHALDHAVSALARRSGNSHTVTVAVSWGGTVAEAARAPMARRVEASVTCVPAHGSTPIRSGVGLSNMLLSWQANEVARRLAERYGGNWYPLYVPALVQNAGVARWFERDSVAGPVLELARKADAVLVGIGSLDRSASLCVAGVLNDQDLQEIDREGGVGDICGRFFRIDGTLCKWKLHDHIVGLRLEDLQGMVAAGKAVIGAAGGRGKSRALLGAIRARAVNHVITDAACCEGALELAA